MALGAMLTCELTGITEASVSTGTNTFSVPDRPRPTSGRTEAPQARATAFIVPRRADSLTREKRIERDHGSATVTIAQALAMRRSRVRPEGLAGWPGLVHDHVRVAELQVRVRASPLRSVSAKAVTCRTTSLKRSG